MGFGSFCPSDITTCDDRERSNKLVAHLSPITTTSNKLTYLFVVHTAEEGSTRQLYKLKMDFQVQVRIMVF